MSRRVWERAEQVEIYKRMEERTCDKCGNLISEDEHYDPARVAHELQVYLNPDECVSFRFRRDYCDNCTWPIWKKICTLIGADPDDISGSSFEDED